jgi:hypothetical protein
MKIAPWLPLVILLGACSRVPAMPPSDFALQPAPAPAATDSVPSRVTHEYDSAAGRSRYVVTTQQGTYFLWMQKPSLAFFVEFPGRTLDRTPKSVYMVFRTQDPQDLDDNRLQLKCDGAPTAFDGLPGSKVVPAIFHNVHYLTFELPRETFDVLAHCGSGEVAVGGIGTRLSAAQLQGLRDLEATFPPP